MLYGRQGTHPVRGLTKRFALTNKPVASAESWIFGVAHFIRDLAPHAVARSGGLTEGDAAAPEGDPHFLVEADRSGSMGARANFKPNDITPGQRDDARRSKMAVIDSATRPPPGPALGDDGENQNRAPGPGLLRDTSAVFMCRALSPWEPVSLKHTSAPLIGHGEAKHKGN